LEQCIFPENATLSVMKQLVNFDQMPQNFHDTRLWTQRLADQALGLSTDAPPLHGDSELEGLLADARFIVGVAAVPKGQPIFRWQSVQGDSFPSRKECREAWEKGVSDVVGNLFTGCQISVLTPDAYYTNNREADRH